MAGLVLNIDVNDRGTIKVQKFQQVVGGTKAEVAGAAEATATFSGTLDTLAGAVGINIEAFTTLEGIIGTLAKTFAPIAAFFGAREIVDSADAYKLLGNRINTVTDSVTEQQTEMRTLLQISQETRSSYEETASLFQRLMINRQEFGATTKELEDFVKQINELGVISGASLQEMQNALIDVVHGLESGYFQGRQLRGVLQQLPAVGRALADGLGTSVGALREMASQGELTSKRIIDAILKMSERTDEQFSKMAITAGQGWQRLTNAAIATVGAIDQKIGGTTALGNALSTVADKLLYLAQHLDAVFAGVERAVRALTTALELFLAYKLAGYIIGATDALAVLVPQIWAAVASIDAMTVANLQMQAAILLSSKAWASFALVLKTTAVTAIIFGTVEAVIYLRQHAEITAQVWANIWFGMAEVVERVRVWVANLVGDIVTDIRVQWQSALDFIHNAAAKMAEELNRVLPQSHQLSFSYQYTSTNDITAANERAKRDREANSQAYLQALDSQKNKMIQSHYDDYAKSLATESQNTAKATGVMANGFKEATAAVDPLKNALAAAKAALASFQTEVKGLTALDNLQKQLLAPVSVQGQTFSPIGQDTSLLRQTALQAQLLQLKRDEITADMAIQTHTIEASRKTGDQTAAQAKLIELKQQQADIDRQLQQLSVETGLHLAVLDQTQLLDLSKETQRSFAAQQTETIKFYDDMNKILVEQGRLSPQEATRQQFAGEERLLRIKLDQAQTELQSLQYSQDSVKVEQAKNAVLEAQQTLTHKIALDNAQLSVQAGSAAQQLGNGFATAFRVAYQSASDFYTFGINSGKQLIGGLQSGLADMFSGIITGTQTVKQAFQAMTASVLKNIADIISKLLAQLAVQQLLGITVPGGSPGVGGTVGVGSLFNGGGLFGLLSGLFSAGVPSAAGALAIGSATTGIPDAAMALASVGLLHSGGVVAKRYHRGGLANDEVPAILQTGEGVLSRRGMAEFNRLNQGGGAGASNVHVTVVNVAPGEEAVYQAMASAKGEAVITNHVVRQVQQTNGPIRHVIRQAVQP